MRVLCYSDGGSRGNPGPAGIGAVVYAEDGSTVLATVSQAIGDTTNNQAEYRAALACLKESLRVGATMITLHLDSELCVKQINGIYRVKNEGIKPLHAEIKQLLSQFQNFKVIHVRREYNKVADALVNKALDALSS